LNQKQQQKLDIYTVLNDLSFAQSRKSQIISQASAVINEYFSTKLIAGSKNSDNPQFYRTPVLPNEYVIVGEKMANITYSQVGSYISTQTYFIPIILFLVIVIASQLVAFAIASEKENKTLETLLSMPVGRKTIVTAKLVASAVVALLSAAIYLFGIRSYMGNITGGAIGGSSSEAVKQAITNLGLNLGTTDFILLGVSLFLGILAALAIALVLGAFAEDAKSVQGVTTPLMVLIFIPYLLTIFVNVDAASPLLKYLVYVIPFSHSFLASQNILFHRYVLYIAGNIYLLLFFVLFVVLASKIFSSDKILTLKLKFKRLAK
jgi:ABC-2 type transport system permease protein